MSEVQTKHPRVFSVAEANRMLPLVRAIVSDLVELSADVSERRRRLADLLSGRDLDAGDVYAAELAEVKRELQEDTQRIRGYLEELRQLGVESRSDDGLVDFPAEYQGRSIYLCWKLGEPEVRFWHEVDQGYAARKPLAPSFRGGGDRELKVGGETLR